MITPGSDGGCEVPPGAYSPRTHLFYAGARYEPQIFRAAPNQETGIGSTFTASIPNVHQDFGIFGAINTRIGKVAWADRVPQPAISGLAVAGDLVFFGQSNGQFDAADARTGKILWSLDGTSIPHGGGADAAPIAYETGGAEFIANAFGGNVPDRRIEGSRSATSSPSPCPQPRHHNSPARVGAGLERAGGVGRQGRPTPLRAG